MLRSLFSGISGLRANQTMLDVTGNNIANANTVGFKSSSVTFAETLSQNVRGAGAPQIDQGGTNPAQIGLGVNVQAITSNMNQGSAQQTGRATDVMIQGDGMFVVREGTDIKYTRAGAFNFDAQGRLVGPSGALVQGYAVDPITGETDTEGGLIDITVDQNAIFPPLDDGVSLTSYQIANDGRVIGTLSDGTEYTFGQIAIADFTNPTGLQRVGETMFQPTANSGDPVLGVAGQGGNGTLLVGALEMSNTDLASEFTNLILAQRGFQASSRVITVSDTILEDLVNLKRN